MCVSWSPLADIQSILLQSENWVALQALPITCTVILPNNYVFELCCGITQANLSLCKCCPSLSHRKYSICALNWFHWGRCHSKYRCFPLPPREIEVQLLLDSYRLFVSWWCLHKECIRDSFTRLKMYQLHKWHKVKETVESHECVHKPLGQDELHCSGGGRPLPPGSVSWASSHLPHWRPHPLGLTHTDWKFLLQPHCNRRHMTWDRSVANLLTGPL